MNDNMIMLLGAILGIIGGMFYFFYWFSKRFSDRYLLKNVALNCYYKINNNEEIFLDNLMELYYNEGLKATNSKNFFLSDKDSHTVVSILRQLCKKNPPKIFNYENIINDLIKSLSQGWMETAASREFYPSVAAFVMLCGMFPLFLESFNDKFTPLYSVFMCGIPCLFFTISAIKRLKNTILVFKRYIRLKKIKNYK